MDLLDWRNALKITVAAFPAGAPAYCVFYGIYFTF